MPPKIEKATTDNKNMKNILKDVNSSINQSQAKTTNLVKVTNVALVDEREVDNLNDLYMFGVIYIPIYPSLCVLLRNDTLKHFIHFCNIKIKTSLNNI